MQESAQNPYIPQESEEIRQKVYERQSPLGRVVKWALIITVVLAIIIAGGLFYVSQRITAVDQPAREKFANILQPPSQSLQHFDVASTLGLRLHYDYHVYNSYAEVGDSSAGSDSSSAILSGQTYENNDLRVSRGYNYIRVRPIESVDTARGYSTIPPQLEIFATISSEDLDKAASVPENKGLSKLSLFVKADSDKRQAKKVADDNTIVTINVTKPVTTTISNVEYQKVRYTTTNDNHRISDTKYDDCYYTIQFNQPYSLCITGVRPNTQSAASLVEDVIRSVEYGQPSEAATGKKDKVSFNHSVIRLAQTTTSENQASADETNEDQLPLLTLKPDYYKDNNALVSISQTQPSVVRVGTIYCTDMQLKYESGDTAATLTDACAGNLATGVIVSNDGYVATTGHAIRSYKKAAIGGYINSAPDQQSLKERLQRILDYLLDAKIILQSDADYILTGAEIGDQEALAKIENIGSVIPDDYIIANNETYSYAIQPSNEPIVINRTDTNKPTFAYSDSVLKASYVAHDYDPTKALHDTFDGKASVTDVGLLKIDTKASFQPVTIASTDTMKSGDTLHILGYPAYTDNSLTVDKIRNQPIVTTTKIEQVYKDENTRFVQTSEPIFPGNDGAPVVGSDGKLLGFAVYGTSYCPDQQCFANGTVRSSSELLKLIDSNNKKINTASTAKKNWDGAVAEFMNANYSSSAAAFAVAGNSYSFNRWAPDLNKLAAINKGSALDTSLMNQLQTILIIVLIVAIVVTIILTIALILHRRRISDARVGHYGATENVQMSVPMSNPGVYASPAVLPTVPQQQQVPQPQNMAQSQQYSTQEIPPQAQPYVQPQPVAQPPGENAQPHQYPAQQEASESRNPQDPFYS